MTVIIGLGNPGKEYNNTRHNVGFMVLDQLVKEVPADFVLAKTKTFMNLSGKAVKEILRNQKPQNKDLILVHDDIDITVGKFKMQKGRGAAGHKGVQSVINELGTKDFWRIRVGVCPERGKPKNVEKFVLQNFTKKEREAIKGLIDEIAKEIERNR